ncbi:hypothetical protein [Streptomyces durocortorensis]|uniref:WXG100 family type VII secretion target n=1 Tax=Streptomyces durocortorensis TaxID=2811104 RepID=A0ABS2HWW7_9ACTN|nr:hypothetical protein [Streptomyces durocortorensis]MBM7055519.1 hypothetical protein [Streptomyces durocortorensis]
MSTSYYEIMTTNLGLLTTAATEWEAMAGELGKIETRYGGSVQKISWAGVTADIGRTNFAATRYEYAAAQVQAQAVASLLRDAHERFTDLKRRLESARDDAIDAGMMVSEQGRVAFDWDKLTPSERSAYVHDPDGQRVIRDSVASWQQHIDDRVKTVSEVDRSVRAALVAAVADSNKDAFGKGDDATLDGFNAHAEGDLAKATSAAKARDAGTTKTDGWVSEGKADLTGPGAEFTMTGPKYGKEGSVKAAADLFHGTAEGSLTNGQWKLSGVGDIYGGARATANYGFTQEGLVAKAEASAGIRALAEGRAEYGPYAGAYGRVEGFAGGEGAASLKVTKEEVTLGAKAFAGARGGIAGGVEVAGIGIGGTAEAWKGAGAEAWVGWKKDENTGAYTFGWDAGLAPGAGGSLGMEITVDPDKVAKSAGAAADAVGDGLDAAGDAAGDAKDAVVDFFS